jgi:hypothetical protein
LSCSINLYRFNSNNKTKTKTIVTIRSHATRSSHLRVIRQSIVSVFTTSVLSDNKHIAAEPTNNGDHAEQNCLQRQVGIIPTPTDDAFIHIAPDRGCKSNVTHCFTQAQS